MTFLMKDFQVKNIYGLIMENTQKNTKKLRGKKQISSQANTITEKIAALMNLVDFSNQSLII